MELKKHSTELENTYFQYALKCYSMYKASTMKEDINFYFENFKSFYRMFIVQRERTKQLNALVKRINKRAEQ